MREESKESPYQFLTLMKKAGVVFRSVPGKSSEKTAAEKH
jgi:hypothetical protein